MNETGLHSRLTALADDLAPDADPYAQIAGARALHRRRQRTRMGIAASAVAVALVAVGVPTAVSTLSAPDRGDVAAPTTAPSEGPEGAAEELRPAVGAVVAELRRLGVDDALPDSELHFPCPDAASTLSMAALMYEDELQPGGINEGGGTLTGCQWSTDASGRTALEARIDLSVTALFDTSADRVVGGLGEAVTERGCRWAALPGDERFTPLTVCPGPQTSWTVTLLDEDGTGAWELRAAVGDDVQGADNIRARTLGALRMVVDVMPTDPPTELDNSAAEEMAARIAARYPDMSAVPVVRDPLCPGPSEELRRAGAGAQPTGSLIDGCVWTAKVRDSANSMAATGSIRRTSDPTLDAISCPTAAVPGWSPGAVLRGCPVDYYTAWTLVIPTYDGSAAWVVTASGGVQPTPDGEGTTLEYLGPSSGDLLTMLIGLVPTR